MLFRNKSNKILESKFDAREGKEIQIWDYDEENNSVQFVKYEDKDGRKILVSREEHQYDARKNKTLYIQYNREDIILEKNVFDYRSDSYTGAIIQYMSKIKVTEALLEKLDINTDPKKESKYYNKNSLTNLNTEILYYKFKDGTWVLLERFISDYDANHNLIQEIKYNVNGKVETLTSKVQYKYDEKNRKIFWASYKIQNGKEFLTWEMIEKYDERDNRLVAKLV